jgi:hypothetical protein
MEDEPPPPLVILDRAAPVVVHLLAWEVHEISGHWPAR